MAYGMYISAAGADAQSRRVEVLSHNLANVDTPGFKSEFAVLTARHSEAIERGNDYSGSRSMNDVGGGVGLRDTMTDFRAGVYQRTGIPTDVAIADDKSFFVVEKEGQKFLTRAGNFRIAADGKLQTQGGHNVLAVDGSPASIDPSNPLPPRFLPAGVLSQGNEGTLLALVRPKSPGDLARAGDNLFAPLASYVPTPEGERRVMEEHLEKSGVKPTEAMMELIEASRAYEANVRLIQHQDSMLGSLVNRVMRQG
jgi:flagellar basal-body rod protein FlgF